jgi:hypothetical protein
MSISFADFLDLLYGDDAAAYTTVSVKLTDGRFVCQTFNLSQRAEIAAHIQKHINYDIYIKRASQFVKPDRGSSGSAEIAYYQRVITADIDIRSAAHAKDALPASKDDALKLLAESGLPEPTLVVHTGNGLMPMWVSARAAVDQRCCAGSDRRRSATAPYRSALRLDAGQHERRGAVDSRRWFVQLEAAPAEETRHRYPQQRPLLRPRRLRPVRAQAAARAEARRRRGDAGND